MAHLIKLEAADAGDDEGSTVLLNLDKVRLAYEMDGRAVVEFDGGDTRTLMVSLEAFTAAVGLLRA